MSLAPLFSEFLIDLQQIEKTRGEGSLSAHGAVILDAFLKHTPFDSGTVYLRDLREPAFRLAAKTHHCTAPESIEGEVPADVVRAGDGSEIFLLSIVAGVDPRPHVLVPLRSSRDHVGLVTLSRQPPAPATDEELESLRTAAAFLNALITNQRLVQEMREGDFQLKYRLWELESLYDIGLSIAATLNIDELADEILFRMISLTNARRAALFLREGTRFVLYRSFGDVRVEFLDVELADQLVKQGEPLTFDGGSECLFPDCHTFVAVPIKGNEVIGVLAAADRETRDGGIGAFEPNELRLLSLFGSQVAIALENARLHKQALEKQAMERELELAATIQRDILPKALPVVEGIDIAALSRPARQVGGDYHAFVEGEGTLTLVVADVSGKSMPAALLVSALHAAIQLLFAEGRELGDIATELNKHIHRWSAENKFITMILVAIDREAESIRYVNAGHNPGYVILGGRLEKLQSHGLPIGILGGTRYAAQTRPFPAGSALVLYSDGITEAENVAGEELENAALEAVLRENVGASAQQLRDEIARAVDAFVGDAPQKDDQTLVIARTA
ncbi:MAG TPA: SpoIIE family protein phosphatase [Thermoanaerobaculia bacterium]|nr:SpoIIE family protein phosphatase [Thermoanaerobaculia bacterium]